MKNVDSGVPSVDTALTAAMHRSNEVNAKTSTPMSWGGGAQTLVSVTVIDL